MKQMDPAVAKIMFLGLSEIKGVGFKSMQDLGGPIGVGNLYREGLLFSLMASVTGRSEKELESFVEKAGEAMFHRLSSKNIELVVSDDPAYPSAFRGMSTAMQPSWIFCRGSSELLSNASVAIVGTRDPTREGEFLTRFATYALKELGVPLVSGLALGVDAIAHETALQAKIPNISVMGTGILRSYPARNSWLADAIVDSGGVLVSEYLPDAEPSATQFVWRNRLQAALAACVVAPQWKAKSGTAHTIQYATRFGRPTINLVPNGLTLPEDHGTALHLFEVPKDHAKFVRLLGDSLSSMASNAFVTQKSLFG